MTENNKRFKLAFEDYDGWGICDTTGEYSNDEDYIDWLSGQKAVDVLNELDSENQQQKTFLKALREELSLADRDNTILEKENKELKKTVSYFAEICACSIETLNEDERLKKEHSVIICTEMEELLKENKELKRQLRCCFKWGRK